MKILLVTLLHPLPTNAARGTFVADHAQLLRDMGHDVRIVNPLPRLLKYMEQSRSTLTGVAKAPKQFEHNEFEIFAPRYVAYTDHPYPWLTSRSIRNRQRSIEKWLSGWRPDHIIAHTLWPVGELARSLSIRWKGLGLVLFTAMMLMLGSRIKRLENASRRSWNLLIRWSS